MIPPRPNYAPEIKAGLRDVRAVCDALGLLSHPGSYTRQAAGFIVRCPSHEERTPSCSVQFRGGEILWRCHGTCQAGGDVLSLIAAVRGLNTRSDFRQVLVEAATLAGLWGIVAELEGRTAPSPRMPIAAPRPAITEPERAWPAQGEVTTLWALGGPVTADGEASACLAGRGLSPSFVDAHDLAKVVPMGTLPRWAAYRGQSWEETGHRLIVPMYDAMGTIRSVRAWRVRDGDSPKRLPPGGCKASGLVMANPFGAAMLSGARTVSRVVIVEGEPDFFARSEVTHDPETAVLGIVSGSWGSAFAERVPFGAQVIIRTDSDATGEKYAEEITKTVARRAFVYRREAA